MPAVDRILGADVSCEPQVRLPDYRLSINKQPQNGMFEKQKGRLKTLPAVSIQQSGQS